MEQITCSVNTAYDIRAGKYTKSQGYSVFESGVPIRVKTS
jgi:hypothetical protein